MSCKYCRNEDDSIDIIKIEKQKDGKYYLSFDNGYDFDLDHADVAIIGIEYCPWCGKKLGSE